MFFETYTVKPVVRGHPTAHDQVAGVDKVSMFERPTPGIRVVLLTDCTSIPADTDRQF